METRVINESYSLKNSRIEHPEDLVLTEGSGGAIKALQILLFAINNPKSITFKPDGKPALIWGKDHNGFAMGDKYMFKKQMPRNPTEMDMILLARKGGNREELVKTLNKLWPIFEQSIENDFYGFVMGDLMYSKIPEIINGYYEFTPNTVTYKVKTDSILGDRIKNSKAGIVAHSYFPDIGSEGVHLKNLNGLKQGELLIISDFLNVQNLYAPTDTNSIIKFVRSSIPAINNFFKTDIELGDILKRYVNYKVRTTGFDDLGNDFSDWIETSTFSKQTIIKARNYVLRRQTEFNIVMQVFKAIEHLKNEIIEQLDEVPTDLTPFINGIKSHEGFVVHSTFQPIKLVKRHLFSSTNFRKNG